MAKISGVSGSGGRRISAFLGVGDWGNFIIPGSCDRRISVVQGFGDRKLLSFQGVVTRVAWRCT